MTRRSPAHKLMIMDACVLIDFIKTDRTVLELVVKLCRSPSCGQPSGR